MLHVDNTRQVEAREVFMGNDIRLAALVALLSSMSTATAVPSTDSAAGAPVTDDAQQAPPLDWV
jgi:hypothetical protein